MLLSINTCQLISFLKARKKCLMCSWLFFKTLMTKRWKHQLLTIWCLLSALLNKLHLLEVGLIRNKSTRQQNQTKQFMSLPKTTCLLFARSCLRAPTWPLKKNSHYSNKSLLMISLILRNKRGSSARLPFQMQQSRKRHGTILLIQNLSLQMLRNEPSCLDSMLGVKLI